MSTTYLFLAPGFEEIEALTPVDLLRRAGVDVQTVAVGETRYVTGAHGVTVEADLLLADEDMTEADMLIAPGGMPGAQNLYDSQRVRQLFERQAARGAYVAAICAAPAVLLAAIGVLKGKNATCYPGFEKMLEEGGATHREGRVVADGNIITANGPASAMAFALALVDALLPGKADEVGRGLLC